MRLPSGTPSFKSLEDVARHLSSAWAVIRSTWTREHRGDGSHKFPWTRVPVANINVTGQSAMTWTPVGNPAVFMKYQHVDTTVELSFLVIGTIGGTPSTVVLILIPDGFVATAEAMASGVTWLDGGGSGQGWCQAVGKYVQVFKDVSGTTWTAGLSSLRGSIRFEVR